MMRAACAMVTPRTACVHAAGSPRRLRTMVGNPQGRLVGGGMDGISSGLCFAALPQSFAAIGEHVVGAKHVASVSCRGLKLASAGNRTRVTSMATMYSTTRPLMLLLAGLS